MGKVAIEEHFLLRELHDYHTMLVADVATRTYQIGQEVSRQRRRGSRFSVTNLGGAGSTTGPT
jgi:hypothetical protein